MYVFLLILLFIGSIMVIDGIYREELVSLKSSKKTEYKFVPKSNDDYGTMNLLDKQFEMITKEDKTSSA